MFMCFALKRIVIDTLLRNREDYTTWLTFNLDTNGLFVA